MNRNLLIAVFVAVAIFCHLSAVWPEASASYYEKAKQLYNEGSSKAAEVIDLLRQELEANPENEKAIKLLGITYFGIKEFEKATEQFDRVIELGKKRNRIFPKIFFLKARALYQLEQYDRALKILEAHWAYFQESEDDKKEYYLIYDSILQKTESTSGK